MSKLFTILLLFISTASFSQTGGVSLSPNGALPDPSSILDLNTPNKGFLLPRISLTQRNAIANPALGLQIYDTTTNCFEAYGFGNWQTLSCLCQGAPSTPGIIIGNNNPCANATSITYTIGLVLGATTYTWTVPSGATIIAGQGTNSITVNFGATPGNISVTANNSCGSSSADNLPVTINTLPGTPGNIVGNPYPCANSTAQAYYILADSGATSYSWSVPSGSIVTGGQGTSSVLVNFYSTPGNLAVTANNTCGNSNASTLPITMATNPNTPGSITGSATFATNQTGLVYFIAPVTEATTYTWTVPCDATITAGQGTDSITVTFGAGSGNICVSAGNCAGTSSGSSCFAVTNTCYTSGSQTFNYTGGQQTFAVPCGVTLLTITAYGAQGGSSASNTGGMGGSATGTVGVTACSGTIYVYVGGQGQVTGGGFNGGGNGIGSGAGGGGGSDVRVGGTALSNRVIVGGGGGGVPYPSWSATGGIGGGTDGGNGEGGAGGTGSPYDGRGGTQIAGGESETEYQDAGTLEDGSLGQGGQAGIANGDGGGGGGGYYGGGGGDAGSGGGGSGYTGNLSNASMQNGVQNGNGQVVISW